MVAITYYLDVDARSQRESHQGIDGLGRRVEDVDEPLMGAEYSNCSRLSLSMNGERRTVNFSMRVGSGTGPTTSPRRP